MSFKNCKICGRSYHILNEKNGHGPVCGVGKSKASQGVEIELNNCEIEDYVFNRKREAVITDGKYPYFRLDASCDLTEKSFKLLEHIMSQYTEGEDYNTNGKKISAIIESHSPQAVDKCLQELSDWKYIEFETSNKGTVIKPKVYPQSKPKIYAKELGSKVEVLRNKTGSSFWIAPQSLVNIPYHSKKVFNAVLKARAKTECDTVNISLREIQSSVQAESLRTSLKSVRRGLKDLENLGLIKLGIKDNKFEITTIGIEIKEK